MTDPKKNPNKQRRSFFWRRKPLLLPEPSKPMNGFDDAQREARPWYRPTLLKAAVVGLGVLAILPTRANGQFGIDIAAILAAVADDHVHRGAAQDHQPVRAERGEV
jgi:hypothetical protein